MGMVGRKGEGGGEREETRRREGEPLVFCNVVTIMIT